MFRRKEKMIIREEKIKIQKEGDRESESKQKK